VVSAYLTVTPAYTAAVVEGRCGVSRGGCLYSRPHCTEELSEGSVQRIAPVAAGATVTAATGGGGREGTAGGVDESGGVRARPQEVTVAE
jgi:hypothetical protein